MKFNKIATVLCLVLATTFLCLCFAGCDNQRDENCIYVGMECGYNPFNYTQVDDANGAVKISNAPGYANGYDVMIAKRIAQKLGKQLVIVKYEWLALVNAVQAGSLDFIIAGMSPTEERKQQIDFSDAYYESQLVIVVRSDGPFADATSLEQLSGAKIVAQLGTFHDLALQEQAEQYGIQRQTPMDTFPNMTTALSVGTIDGYVAEEPGAIADCAAAEGLTYVPLINNQTGFTVSAEDVQIAVGLQKNSPLKDQVNQALAAISSEERAQMMQLAIQLATGQNVE